MSKERYLKKEDIAKELAKIDIARNLIKDYREEQSEFEELVGQTEKDEEDIETEQIEKELNTQEKIYKQCEELASNGCKIIIDPKLTEEEDEEIENFLEDFNPYLKEDYRALIMCKLDKKLDKKQESLKKMKYLEDEIDERGKIIDKCTDFGFDILTSGALSRVICHVSGPFIFSSDTLDFARKYDIRNLGEKNFKEANLDATYYVNKAMAMLYNKKVDEALELLDKAYTITGDEKEFSPYNRNSIELYIINAKRISEIIQILCKVTK